MRKEEKKAREKKTGEKATDTELLLSLEVEGRFAKVREPGRRN